MATLRTWRGNRREEFRETEARLLGLEAMRDLPSIGQRSSAAITLRTTSGVTLQLELDGRESRKVWEQLTVCRPVNGTGRR